MSYNIHGLIMAAEEATRQRAERLRKAGLIQCSCCGKWFTPIQECQECRETKGKEQNHDEGRRSQLVNR